MTARGRAAALGVQNGQARRACSTAQCGQAANRSCSSSAAGNGPRSSFSKTPLKVLKQVVGKDLVARGRLRVLDLGVKHGDAVKRPPGVRHPAGRVPGPIDAAVGPDTEERLHQEGGERVPVGVRVVGARQAQGRRPTITQERVDEALREHGTRVGAELKAVRVDEAGLHARRHQHVQIVEVADDDAGGVNRRYGGVDLAEQLDDIPAGDARAPEAGIAVAKQGLRRGDDWHRVADDDAAGAIGRQLLGGDHLPG